MGGEELIVQDLIIQDGHEDELQSRLATSLLRGHGELLISLGAHPSPIHRYNPEPNPPDVIPTIGIALSPTQIDAALKKLKTVCDELKAELNELYRIDDGDKVYGCWLVRLTPRGVEEIMEVRVAVVGNVDAGKSTTLGVLTRGGLDDGRGKVSIGTTRHTTTVNRADGVGTSSVIPTPTRDRDGSNIFRRR